MSTRREFLAGAAALAALPVLGRAEATAPQKRKRVLRIAHMTDFHIQPELHANEGSRQAMIHAMMQKPRPDLIIAGGDLVMDSFSSVEERTRVQWDLFDRLVRDHAECRLTPVLGNHDVWGWNREKSGTTGQEPLWGTGWFKNMFGLDKTYYSLVQNGWKIIVLDTLIHTSDGYNGLIEPEQMEWLKKELSRDEQLPVLVASHIPLIAPCNMVEGYDKDKGEWVVGGNLQTKNFNEVKALFDKNPQVKLCISGHIHLNDVYWYDGVTYLCGGAVCGAWWNGLNGRTAPGYRLLDLYSDGSFDQKYVEWGWKAG